MNEKVGGEHTVCPRKREHYQKLRQSLEEDWRGGSVVKSTLTWVWFPVSTQKLTTIYVTPVPGALMPSSDLCGHQSHADQTLIKQT